MALSPTQEIVCFGLFELDLKASQLTRNGTRIRLPQQPLRLLSVLIESAGEIVTREQIQKRLWPADVFIDFDHGLNKSMQKLRDALGDSAASPRYIETIPRVGYRFIAPVREGSRILGAVAVPGISPAPQSEIETPSLPPPVANPAAMRWLLSAAGVLAIAASLAVALYLSSRAHPGVPQYTQLTDFTDSATSPTLSPDGHMIAFIRGDSAFLTSGQIYAKMLPDGEAKSLTKDARPKYNLAFSPDGTQIAYTVLEQPSFATYTVSALGGDPHLLLENAAGLTWLDPQHYLFSRVRSGLHLGVVTQSIAGDDLRELYFPPAERAMAHYSFASPDRKHALVVEMNAQGGWTMCRLIALQRESTPTPIGPRGGCTAAGWSPDGASMYFVAIVGGQSHIWRQQYPDGQPEQVTVGPSQEEGLAVEQDGRSIITSIGEWQRAIWIHDAAGERSLSSEGEIVTYPSPPSFAADQKTLYYLSLPKAGASVHLWRLALDTGKAAELLPGTSMDNYDISPDGKQVVYSSRGRDGRSHLWLAAIDRTSPPRQIGPAGATIPHFGPHGKVLFLLAEGNVDYLEQTDQNSSEQSKALPYPILEVQGISPGRKWLTAVVSLPDKRNNLEPMVVAIPLDGGSPRRICASYCSPVWSSNGKFLIVPVEPSSQSTPGRSLAIPVGAGEELPKLPPEGIPPLAAPSTVLGSQSINRSPLVPGKDPSHYAYVNTTVHRNLYRISLP